MPEPTAPTIRITKIKYDGKKVRLEYQRIRADDADPDEFSLQASDRPARSFAEALEALAQDVVTIAELAPTDRPKITVRGVTITWTNDILGAVITALKALQTANAPLVLNTPHLPSEPYSEDGGGPLLAEATLERLQAMMHEAERYLDGERADQGALFAAKTKKGEA